MVLKRIGYYYYDSEDIIGDCQLCNGDIYNVPEYIWRIPLTAQQLQLFQLGELKIGLCPVCMTFYTRLGDVTTILVS
jgi:hypothetical protein